eukprot:396351-Rhodomonas_salina.3
MLGTDTANGTAYAQAMRCPVVTERLVLPAYARTTQCPVLTQRVLVPGYGLRRYCRRPTPRNPIQETAISVQCVPGIRFLVIDFGVYAVDTRCPVLT